MSDIDHVKLGKSIAKAMKSEGMIKEVVHELIPPLLEKHKREIIRDNAEQLRAVATQNGFDCDDVFENQKDLAHLRADRVAAESNVRRIKEWAFGVSLAGIAAFLGIDKLL